MSWWKKNYANPFFEYCGMASIRTRTKQYYASIPIILSLKLFAPHFFHCCFIHEDIYCYRKKRKNWIMDTYFSCNQNLFVNNTIYFRVFCFRMNFCLLYNICNNTKQMKKTRDCGHGGNLPLHSQDY